MRDRMKIVRARILQITSNALLRAYIKIKVFFTGSVKVYWWKHPEFPNFGDELGPEIIEKLFNIRCTFAPSRQAAELLSVGSILNETHGGVEHGGKYFVWGSGFNDPAFIPVRNWLKVCAVRGKITRDRLKVNDVPLGDPGLLANLVYTRSESEDKIGIIPHLADLDNHIIKKFKNNQNYIIISPARTPDEVIYDITKCKIVFSSSLHGLIVADSFGVPNYHIDLSNKVEGGDLKFDDYYSATTNWHKKANITKLLDNDYISHLINEYQPISNLDKIQTQLISAFPFRSVMGGGQLRSAQSKR